jgi:hypothetical protein
MAQSVLRLRQGRLVAGQYFVSITPFSGEQGNYDRGLHTYLFTGSRPFTWVWAFSVDYPEEDDHPPVRMLVDGAPATDFVTPGISNNRYTFVFDVANGHHIVDFEGLPANITPLRKGFIVNTSEAKLTTQAPYATNFCWEFLYDNLGQGYAQFPYPGDPVVPRKDGSRLAADRLIRRKKMQASLRGELARWGEQS